MNIEHTNLWEQVQRGVTAWAQSPVHIIALEVA